VLGGRRVTGHVEKIRPGQGGRRIVEEAREIKARALIMAVPRRPRAAGSPFGRTLETVLADRPCRVIITTEPPKARSESLVTPA
jgi:APA family basic amino acid/polyamine antiporter